jgi:hypothetical protein
VRQLKHPAAKNLFRAMTGQTHDVAVRRPGIRALTERLQADIASPVHPTRILAYSKKDQLPVLLSEEDRETHIHLLGSTRQGKSRLIQLLMQGDIERGFGCCLLDPSDSGDTAVAVLKHCAEIGFEKVVYINPSDFQDFNAVPVINPFDYDMPAGSNVGNIKNALQILWQTEMSETPRIEKYLDATLTAIHRAGGTLADIRYFLDDDKDYFADERWHIINALAGWDDYQRGILKRPFEHKRTFENHYQPTVNRLAPFIDPYLQRIFGSRGPAIPFADLIMEGWVILLNLDSEGIWGRDLKPQKLLGTLVVDQVIRGVYRARRNGWRGRFNLYIDEVGDFSTPDLPYIIDKKSKAGLRITVAHQRFNQIKDSNVLSSLRSIGNKVLFWVRTEDDRRQMMRDMGYGGKISLDDVSFELGSTPKQEAVFSINKTNPVLARLVDVPDSEVSDKKLRSFKEFIYSEYVWMHPPNDIDDEIHARFANAQPVPNRGDGDSAEDFVEQLSGKGRKGKNSKRARPSKRGTVPDD